MKKGRWYHFLLLWFASATVIGLPLTVGYCAVLLDRREPLVPKLSARYWLFGMALLLGAALRLMATVGIVAGGVFVVSSIIPDVPLVLLIIAALVMIALGALVFFREPALVLTALGRDSVWMLLRPWTVGNITGRFPGYRRAWFGIMGRAVLLGVSASLISALLTALDIPIWLYSVVYPALFTWFLLSCANHFRTTLERGVHPASAPEE